MLAAITDTQGIVAIAAAAVASVALLGCVTLSISVRRLRKAQRLVLGEHGEHDVVEHAATLQEAFEALGSYVEDTATRLDARLAGVEAALRGRIAHRALVRYDAYNELSGHQSMSIALLDDERSGIVLSCIHHRDQARVYGKQVQAGRGELELSPEEAEAVRLAIAGGAQISRPQMSREPDREGARPRVGYLGPAGTFSEEALLASAAPDAVEPYGLASIYDAVMALRDGDVSWAIVPIENSLEGSINVTLDLLAGGGDDVKIVGEALLRVRHSLIGVDAVALTEIETVITHPQVPGQCTLFLRNELAHAKVLTAASTAEAVRTVVAEGRREQTALGTPLAAEIYGATVIREGVEDREDNETRFVWLAGVAVAGQPAPLLARTGAEWKTSLVFWGAGAERSGWLVRCLDEFARRDINLTKIESRPRREGLGSYMFFADLAAASNDHSVAEAIASLRVMCEDVRVLGSYPSAAEPRG